MNNYEKLKKSEEEKDVVLKELGEEAFQDIEPDLDFRVKRISTGQGGYVESFLNSTDVCFIVPDEDLKEYRVTIEEFNSDFIELK